MAVPSDHKRSAALLAVYQKGVCSASEREMRDKVTRWRGNIKQQRHLDDRRSDESHCWRKEDNETHWFWPVRCVLWH